ETTPFRHQSSQLRISFLPYYFEFKSQKLIVRRVFLVSMRMFMRKVLNRGFLFFCHISLIAFTTFLQDMLDLGNRNNREEFRKQEETGEEQTKSSKVETNFPQRRSIVGTPATGQIVAVDRSYNDHETFE